MLRTLIACALAIAGTVAASPIGHTQTPEDGAVEHAKRVFGLLQASKFDDLAKEFNDRAGALMGVSQLQAVWTAVRQQAGEFKSLIDQKVTTPTAGTKVVALGCQFEKMAVNFVVAFDRDDRIAGLRLAPRFAEVPAAVPPPSSRFSEEAVIVGSGEWALPGTLAMPTGPIAGAIVLVHGSGPNDRDETIGPNKPFADLAWGLANRGVAVLRYDKRTRVYSAKMAADTNMTVREETTADALLAAALLRRHERIDPQRVFVLGHSLGGMLAPRIAAEDASIAGLIIMAGSTRPLLESAREQIAYLDSLNPGAVDPDQALQALKRAAPDSYWKDLDSYKPAEAAARLTIPMLILQGERDYQVTMQDLCGWREAIGGRRNVTIKTYPTLNHLFIAGEGKSTPAEYQQPGHVADVVLDDIADWIKKR